MRIALAAAYLAFGTLVASAQGQPADKSGKSPHSTGITVSPETKGQSQPQGLTGPVDTKSEGAPAASPQGQTPPGMQAAPGGSSKTVVDPDSSKNTIPPAAKGGGQREPGTLQDAGESLPWVAPVGRLDKASEGLLLLTNDSEWGARVAAPDTHLPKTYHVQIGSIAGEQLAQALTAGVKRDGESLRAVAARVHRSGEKNSWLEITLDEGKNRQIRRMLAGLGVEVLRLVRVAIGPLQLGKLPKGAHRALTVEELHSLNHAMSHVPLRFNRSLEAKEA